LVNIITNKDIEKGIEFIQFFFTLLKEFSSVSLILNKTTNKSSFSQQIYSEKMIKEIENIISFLNQNPSSFTFTEIYFKTKTAKTVKFSESFSDWLLSLENFKDDLMRESFQDQRKEEIRQIQNEIKILRKKLSDSTIDSNQTYFSKIHSYLSKMEPSFENLEQAKLNVARAIQLSNISYSNEKSSLISFPPPSNQKPNCKRSKHQSLCNMLIRHTEILNLISQIEDNKDPIQSIISFERYSELADPVRLLSQFILTRPSQFNSPAKKQLISSLRSFENAFTFSSLYSLTPEYLQAPSKLIKKMIYSLKEVKLINLILYGLIIYL
jgi:hypothetical protein